ncbi:carbonic anhydrase [Maricaulis sp.]|jgi:carbonic anhydrase|nr:carbonic anhydrase [Maricaulis sp.]MDF1767476.1 carbonic anhydrase [Maricaulis sp.]
MTIQPPKPLLDGYRAFCRDAYKTQRAHYEELSKGQSPHTLIIACSDSRVDPAVVFNARPGDLFVVRNVANLVPPMDDDGGRHGVSAAIEFAVRALGVDHIVVMGHGQCGGVAASVAGLDTLSFKYLGPWLEPLEPARAEVHAEHAGGDNETLCDALELNSIRHSIERLHQFDFIERAIADRGLQLHGARFSIHDGVLEWMGADGAFAPV